MKETKHFSVPCYNGGIIKYRYAGRYQCVVFAQAQYGDRAGDAKFLAEGVRTFARGVHFVPRGATSQRTRYSETLSGTGASSVVEAGRCGAKALVGAMLGAEAGEARRMRCVH